MRMKLIPDGLTKGKRIMGLIVIRGGSIERKRMLGKLRLPLVFDPAIARIDNFGLRNVAFGFGFAVVAFSKAAGGTFHNNAFSHNLTSSPSISPVSS